MKNNALKLLSLALIVPLMTACPKKKDDPLPPPPPAAVWSEEIDEAMLYYCGEVLPFAELDLETLTYGYDEEYSEFYLEDVNEENVLENYAEALAEAGFEEVENDYYGLFTYITYDKTNDLGFISLTFGYDEGDEEEGTAPGNYINVAVPEFITEDLLIEYGYTKQQDWPTQLVADTMEGSDFEVPSVNANGEWFVASELAHDDEYGDWYCAYLATKGDFADEMVDKLLDAGCGYNSDYDYYYDATGTSDFAISVAKIRDFTIINIEGPTLVPELPDISVESENLDGSITVTYTFANALVEGTSYEETFESESCNLTVGKGGNANNAPTYYTSGASLRCYYKNTLVLEAAQGYEIQSVNLTVGFVKNLTINDVSASAGTVSASGTVPGATVAVNGVNAGSLTITVGANATKGNVGFSAIEVVLAAVR